MAVCSFSLRGIATDNGRVEIVTEVAFQFRFQATNDYVGYDPAVWDAGRSDWAYRNGHSNHDWSEPIFEESTNGLMLALASMVSDVV
jgi:hypothetical protein